MSITTYILLFFLVLIILSGLFIVKQQTAAIIERFGRFLVIRQDDVFVKLKVSVQYKVLSDKVYDAFYKLDYPQDQITSYVFDVV